MKIKVNDSNTFIKENYKKVKEKTKRNTTSQETLISRNSKESPIG